MFGKKEALVPRIIDKPVTVDLTSAGDPAASFLDRFEHTIIGQPQAIFTRTRWWEQGSAPRLFDIELWRVDAVKAGVAAGGEEQHRYDLRRN
jgi:hypothetical protein